jgi:hypothetical protein
MSIHHLHLEFMGVILVPHRKNYNARTLQFINESLSRSAHHANQSQIWLWNWLG